MKIIHTADWHIGHTFFDFDRKHEHLIFLDWLTEKITEANADLLLLAGDIFDSPNPSAESQRIFYSFIKNVTDKNPQLQIIVTSGNHDSAARLEAVSPLIEDMNVTIKGIIRKDENNEIDFDNLIVNLKTGGICLAVPYIRQGDYPLNFTYQEGIKSIYTTLKERIKGYDGPVIAMRHLQATGSELSEADKSERSVIGGLESVDPDTFDSVISYTALGHLHKAQRVSKRENIRYSGTPLPMSFAEINNKQGVTYIEINDGDDIIIDKLIFEPPVKLISIPDKAELPDIILEILNDLPDGEPDNFSPFLEIKIRLIQPEPALRYNIESALKGKNVRLARITLSTDRLKSSSESFTYEELEKINPMDMANDIFKKEYGGDEMPEELKKMLKSVIDNLNQTV